METLDNVREQVDEIQMVALAFYETHLQPGDEIWFMRDGKPIEPQPKFVHTGATLFRDDIKKLEWPNFMERYVIPWILPLKNYIRDRNL